MSKENLLMDEDLQDLFDRAVEAHRECSQALAEGSDEGPGKLTQAIHRASVASRKFRAAFRRKRDGAK